MPEGTCAPAAGEPSRRRQPPRASAGALPPAGREPPCPLVGAAGAARAPGGGGEGWKVLPAVQSRGGGCGGQPLGAEARRGAP